MPTTRFRGVGFADDDVEGAERVLLQPGQYQVDVLRSIPSVLERVRLLTERDVSDPSTMTSEHVAEIVGFCRHHDINADEAAALGTARPHEAKEKRGLWQSILLNLRNYEEGDPEAVQEGRIPIAEIHVPGVAGCECKYKQQAGTSQKVGLTLKIRGLGGGGGREAKVTFSNEVASPRCGQVTIPGKYQVTPWTNTDYGSRIDLVTFTEFKPESVGLRAIPMDRSHLCSPGVSARLAELRRTTGAVFETHPMEVPGSILTPSQSVEKTRELTLSVDNLLEVKSQFIEGFSYEWKILGAANYVRFFENSRSHVHFWGWDVLA